MVPSFSIRASRFCTVPRATCNVLAKEATDNRALSRNRDSSWRSVESMGPPSERTSLYKTSIYAGDIARKSRVLIRILAFLWLDDLRNYQLAELVDWGDHGGLHRNRAPARTDGADGD